MRVGVGVGVVRSLKGVGVVRSLKGVGFVRSLIGVEVRSVGSEL